MMKVGLRKIFVAFAALVSVVIIACFYLLVLVPNKENELNSRGLRILSQIEQNILEKKANVQKTLDGVYSRRDKEGRRKFRGSFFRGLSADPDSIPKRNTKEKVDQGSFNPVYNAVADRWQIRFFGRYLQDDVQNKDSVLSYRYEMDIFLKDVLFYRDDFFEDYIVLHEGKVVYQTNSLAYAGLDGNIIGSGEKKPSNRSGKILLSDQVKRDTLGGKSRLVFVHPFNQATEANIVLCGIISAEKYNNEKYLLNTTEIIWITLIFVMAAFSLPVLKLFTVSEFERLSQYDVLRVGIALTAGSSVLSVCYLLWIHNASQYNRQAYVTRQVAQSIERGMVEEVKSISLQWDRQVRLLCGDASYATWIEDPQSLRGSDALVTMPDSVHQVETFVLLNEKGQGLVFDMNEKSLITQLDLHEREYFKAFDKEHPEISPYMFGEGGNKSAFYLQPIYSWLDQQNTVVISKALDKRARDKLNCLFCGKQSTPRKGIRHPNYPGPGNAHVFAYTAGFVIGGQLLCAG